ncbi:iron-siderophore ABC transporter substrate-binding protein [Agrobacterium leguminum]|uniref:iron-siderophore ABC transporter substrate-binding protein n=1 Tax=Agrobacterium leguminum TaxID=2792015 RepID=UPI0022025CA5|nr:iron-siderophore ABC transporter substrate-binding protein [Agrobacterium tumefaciens]
MPDHSPTRRQLMAAALTLPWQSVAKAAMPKGGIVSLDYGLASTLLALGTAPAAIAARADWDTWMVEPAMPEGVADLGLTAEINFEVLARLKPDVILSTPFLASLTPKLQSIAPVMEFPIYTPESDALTASYAATRKLAAALNREQRGEDFLSRAEACFADCRRRLEKLRPPPVAVINFMDERHARVYGGPGLYQGAMEKIGLANAWPGKTNYWGFETIALEALAALSADARLIAFEPLTPPDVLSRLDQSPLWSNLPFVRAGRVSTLPGVLMFGMVQEAMRFARLVTDHLESHA